MIAKYLLFIFIFVVHISATDANVSTNICKDYLDPDLRESMTILKAWDKKISIDINNDGKEEIVSKFYNSNGYYNNIVYVLEDQYGKEIDTLGLEETKYALNKNILFYKGRYYIVFFYSITDEIPIFIAYLDSRNLENPVCKYKFKQSLKLTFVDHSNGYTPEKCDTFFKIIEKEEMIPFDIPSKFKTKRYHRIPVDTGNIGYLDYNNDGKKEYLQSYIYIYNETRNYYNVYNNIKTLDLNETFDIPASGWFKANNKIYSFQEKETNEIDIDIEEKGHKRKTVCRYEDKLDSLSLEKVYNK